MPDPILTPEQVADARTFLGQPGCSCEQYIAQLCDSHESLRELAVRLARALVLWADTNDEARRCTLLLAGQPGADAANERFHRAADDLRRLADDPAVQSLIAASKEAADGN